VTVWFKNFKTWLFPNPDTTEPEASLNQLPPEMASQIKMAIQQLPSPLVYQNAVQESLKNAIARWQENPTESPNHLVILGSPVETIELILKDALEELKNQISLPITPLSIQRPSDCTNLAKKLTDFINQETSNSFNHQELIVIPKLAECFLRCIGGLGAIEYLRDEVLANKTRFWLIGCNHWAWSYLGYVCQLNVFLEQTFLLPALTSSQLEEWLDSAPIPLAKTRFIPSPLQAGKEFLEEQAVELEQLYFQKLSDTSLGVSRIANKLWLRSLRYQSDKDEGKNLLQTAPNLPDLPSLTSSDRYLLYSLLLHERMSLSALALSLGDVESMVQPHVQRLQQLGLILKQQQEFTVNPLHYPKLKVELEQNNFLTEVVT
jgi:biotin operon repressor